MKTTRPARTAIVVGMILCAGWGAAKLVGEIEGALKAESISDHGVVGGSFDLDGVHGLSDGELFADHGVYGTTNSTATDDAGVRGENTGDGPGVYGRKDTSGEGGYGVRGHAQSNHGVYGTSDGGLGNYGGWFEGRGGVFGQSDDFIGSALHGKCPEADDTGCWAVDATSEGGRAIVGDTRRSDQNYGLYTGDNLYVGGTCTGCTVAIIVRNGGGGELVAGDVVAVTGVGEALPQEGEPTILVDRVAGGRAFGVVQNTLEIELLSRPEQTFVEVSRPDPEGGPPDTLWQLRTEDREIVVHRGVERPALPGEHLVIVVQGMARVRADASLGPVAAGNRLIAAAGTALSSAALARSTEDLPGVGTALEALHQGQSLIWAWVDPE